MSVILVLVILAIVIAGGFLAAFIWATRNGQFDDTESPAVRMLFEDKKPEKTNTNPTDTSASAKSST